MNRNSKHIANLDIRRKAAGAGVYLWQIADALGIADATLSRKLRKEFSDEDRERIYHIIDQLAREEHHG